ncbi:MAG TPA: benzoate-CoA ligase family protein [Streptosporangiaceae bacterium]|nr:benzoate-CoA ligase family protein [Streptosporangiaceae bacterium]
MPEPFNVSTYLIDRHVAEGRGERVAVTGPAGTLSYAELLALVESIAAGLRELGVRPEERVVMVAADTPQLLAAILAAMRIGAVAVPVNTMLTGRELGELFRDTRARIAIVSGEFAATAAQAAAAAPELRDVVLAAAAGAGAAATDADAAAFPAGISVTSLPGVIASGSRYGAGSQYPTWGDSAALWLYTSGTTGTAKGVVHRHANIRHVAESYPREVLGITADDRCYSVAKLFFAYGIGNSAFFPLSVGGTVILDPARPTPALVAERLASYRPTLFFAVPSFYAALLAADVPAGALGSVRLAVSAGETLPAAIYQRFLDRFGVGVLDGIGSTEALHIFLSNRPGSVRPGSSGTPVTGYEVEIRDGQGAPVADGLPGDLYLKAPSAALGYWCRTDTTREVFQGEWLRTGDVYMRSADGYYTCLGRSSDMIKAGGIWVSPAEVEARLLEHPGVAQAAVVGLADADGLETPVACVVRAPGEAAQAADLVAFCRDGLAAFKRPREIFFVESLPATATGKLRRFAVRETAAKLLAESGRATLRGGAAGA